MRDWAICQVEVGVARNEVMPSEASGGALRNEAISAKWLNNWILFLSPYKYRFHFMQRSLKTKQLSEKILHFLAALIRPDTGMNVERHF